MSKEKLAQKRKKVLVDQVYPILERNGVPQHFWPKKIGDLYRGEWQFEGIESVEGNAFVPLWTINYQLKNPANGKMHIFTIRYSNAATAVVKINWLNSKRKPSILVTRQFRPCTNEWEVEFPQAFTNSPGPGERQFNELSEKKIDWLTKHSQSWEKTYIGQFKDDPGARSTVTKIYFIELWITEEGFESALLGLNNGKTQTRKTPFQFDCLSVEEVDERIDNGQLDSLILLGAWMKALRNKEIQLA